MADGLGRLSQHFELSSQERDQVTSHDRPCVAGEPTASLVLSALLKQLASDALVCTTHCTLEVQGGAALRRLPDTTLSIPLLLGLGFDPGSSSPPGSIRGDVLSKGTSGEPAALLAAHFVLRRPVTTESESDTKGAFAIDSLPLGAYQMQANAPGLCTARAMEVGAGTHSIHPVEMAAVASTTLPHLTQLKAAECAFDRKVHHV